MPHSCNLCVNCIFTGQNSSPTGHLRNRRRSRQTVRYSTNDKTWPPLSSTWMKIRNVASEPSDGRSPSNRVVGGCNGGGTKSFLPLQTRSVDLSQWRRRHLFIFWIAIAATTLPRHSFKGCHQHPSANGWRWNGRQMPHSTTVPF